MLEQLNAPSAESRLSALTQLADSLPPRKLQYEDVNNHIHTSFSFSPYSPTKAVWMAYQAGLATAGLVDHDSFFGAREFIEAGRILGLPTTVGVECRADLSKTPLQGRRVNNPDQCSVCYMAIHGIPHSKIEEVQAFFAPYLEARMVRNRRMTERIHALMQPYGLGLDFEADVVPVSCYAEGGSITERHILFALAQKLVQAYPQKDALLSFLKQTLGLDIPGSVEALLMEEPNPHYAYDLLGVLKSSFVEKMYIDATDECPDIREVVSFADSIGAIAAYAYLGDVEASVTGDKKAQKFEDDYLEELFEVLQEVGFRAVTYMPTRNTPQQLARIKDLCARYGMFEICGEDVNSPRQSFVCKALREPDFSNLITAAWALIGHEILASTDLKYGFFAPETVQQYPDLAERTAYFAKVAKQKYQG